MNDFNPAFPKPVKWSTGENKYDQSGKNPVNLSLFIPLESAYAFAQYVMTLADDTTRHKTGKVWDYATKSEVEVPGIYVNGRGRDGARGSFGQINPQAATQPQAGNDMPF